MSLKNTLRGYAKNLLGPRLSDKIIVIESDDWGALRMPSREIYERLLNKGYQVDRRPYERNDSLESQDDMTHLLEVLSKFKDSRGKHPAFTAMSVVANPNFEKIKNCGFSEYHYLTLPETLKLHSQYGDPLTLQMQGLQEGLWSPQFHGREHVNVCKWLAALQAGDQDNLLAFHYGIPGFFSKTAPEKGNPFASALRYDTGEESKFVLKSLHDGIKLFRDLYKLSPRVFMAPSYTWTPEIEQVLCEKGVNYIQSEYYQKLPQAGQIAVKRHYFGQKNQYGQYYLLRNCYFEPAQSDSYDHVGHCLSEISRAFTMKKPATISTHRLNYTGSIHPENRKRSLKLLTELLTRIIKTWPEVEFYTSSELGDRITKH